MVKPTFIGIGVQKAATSWLHDALSAHPDVFVSEPKELDFFTHHFNQGYSRYERAFAGSEAKAARGESSPSYFYEPAVPERIKTYVPEARLIVIFREPVGRAFSNHLHEIRKGHLSPTVTFEAAEPRNPMYLEQGRYATHLKRWIEVFGREAILALFAEEIAADPAAALDQTYRHIGVSIGFRPPHFEERRHESVANRNDSLQAMLKFGGDRLRALGLGPALENFKRVHSVKRLLDLNKEDLRANIPEMKPETRQRLQDYFAGENRDLAKLLGRRSLPWSDPSPHPAREHKSENA
jgi:hypothetical protein